MDEVFGRQACRRLTVKLRPLIKITAILLVSVPSIKAFAQQSEASTISNQIQAAEVEQAIRNFYKAF